MKWLFILLPFLVLGQDPDLPTIESTELKSCLICHGFGRYATGGRGGSVIKVTNTNSSGTGSLREALETSGTRTIIFEVDGNIEITSFLSISNDDYTVAGQSAPGDGVAIWGDYGIENRAEDVIVRHVRFRGSGDGDGTNRSNFRIRDNSGSGGDIDGVMLDHVSMSWPDEDEMNVEVSAKDGFSTQNVTIQYSILGESDRNILVYKDGSRLTVYRNLLSQSNQRGVRTDYPDLVTSTILKYEEINNILHGWNTPPIQLTYGDRITALNNILTSSSSITASISDMVRVQAPSAPDGETGTLSETYAYLSGNVNEVSPGDIENSTLTPYVMGSALQSSDATTILLDAVDLEDEIVDYLGARWSDARDTQDAAMISAFSGGTGTLSYNGTLPTLSGGTYPTDTDDDGMSDAFEDLHGLNKNSATDRNDTKQSWTFSGLCNYENTADYTNLEVYLAFLAGDFQMMIDGIEAPDGSWTLTAAVGGGITITPRTRVSIGSSSGKVIIGG